MAILVDASTRVLCQGITGAFGGQHTRGCCHYGTNMVGGVTPGKGGTFFEIEAVATGAGWEGRDAAPAARLPVFNTVTQAVRETGADATMVFVPPPAAPDAILEAADAGLRLVCCITEGIPVLDMVRVKQALARYPRTRLIGPNSPGVITPGACKIGIMPGYIHRPGGIGVLSRSGTLTYEAVWQLTRLGAGQSTCVGLGGDPVRGTNYIEMLELFQRDPATAGVVLIGEIGGSDEEDAAAWIARNMTKPVVAFVAGRTAPPGRRMGHAGAIAAGGVGTAEGKVRALRAAGVTVCDSPADIGAAMVRALSRRTV